MKTVPVGPKNESEQYLTVLFSMLKIGAQEAEAIRLARAALTEKALKEGAKKGVFGAVFGKK